MRGREILAQGVDFKETRPRRHGSPASPSRHPPSRSHPHVSKRTHRYSRTTLSEATIAGCPPLCPVADPVAAPAAPRRRSRARFPACPMASRPVCPACNWTTTCAANCSATRVARRSAARCSHPPQCAEPIGTTPCVGSRSLKPQRTPALPAEFSALAAERQLAHKKKVLAAARHQHLKVNQAKLESDTQRVLPQARRWLWRDPTTASQCICPVRDRPTRRSTREK